MKFDAIVFDFDGVLVESADIKTYAFGVLYAKYGSKIQKRVVAHHISNAGLPRFQKFRIWQEEFLGLPYTDEEGDLLSEEFSRLVLDAVVAAPCVQGAKAFLESYHKRMPLYIASGTPEIEMHEIVHRRQMVHFFKRVYGSPSVKTQILKEVIEEGGFAPHRVLMVGDALIDYRSAQELGACFVGRVPSEGEMIFPRETTVIPDLTRLPDFI